MGTAVKAQLNRALNEHLNNIHETFQILDQSPASSLEKVSWKDVIQMSEELSKQATMVGMLYSGQTPEHKVLEENMAAYFNLLQGFLLLCHGSSVGAGPTLLSCIQASVKDVVDGSFKLFQGALSSYGSSNKTQNLSISQLVGIVWDACSALKKTPSANVTAIGRAITQVVVSVKDVLREMKELKPSSSEQEENESNMDGDSCDEEDMGNDLSTEEMEIAHLATSVVSETLVVLKELVRSITSLLRKESLEGCAISVDSLEKLLKLCKVIGVQVDEIGVCLYPPQEISSIRLALGKISSSVSDMEVELGNLNASSEDFCKACADLKKSLGLLEEKIQEVELIPELEKLVVSN